MQIDWRPWIKLAIFIAIGGFLLVAINQGWLGLVADKNRIAGYLEIHRIDGLLMITLLGALFTAFGGARQVLAFVLGFSMNAFNGTVLSTLITLLGSTAAFFCARYFLRQNLESRFGHHLERMDHWFKQNAATKVLLIRLFPLGSNLLTNLISGCSGIRYRDFVVGSAIGFLPQMLVFALAGAGIGNANEYQFSLSLVLFAVALLVTAYMYRRRSFIPKDIVSWND